MAGNRRKSVVDSRKSQGKRLNVQMREDALTRLMLHCVMLGRNPGDLLSDLVDSNLREFRVQRNASARATQDISAEIEDQREESLQDAA
jgi:hypothetical protein